MSSSTLRKSTDMRWLSDMPRIGTRSRPDLWPSWTEAHGLDARALEPTLEFDNTLLAIRLTPSDFGRIVCQPRALLGSRRAVWRADVCGWFVVRLADAAPGAYGDGNAHIRAALGTKKAQTSEALKLGTGTRDNASKFYWRQDPSRQTYFP